MQYILAQTRKFCVTVILTCKRTQELLVRIDVELLYEDDQLREDVLDDEGVHGRSAEHVLPGLQDALGRAVARVPVGQAVGQLVADGRIQDLQPSAWKKRWAEYGRNGIRRDSSVGGRGEGMQWGPTHERQPGMDPGIDGDIVRQRIPVFNFLLETRQDDLVQQVLEDPRRQEGHPVLQQFDQGMAVPTIPGARNGIRTRSFRIKMGSFEWKGTWIQALVSTKKHFTIFFTPSIASNVLYFTFFTSPNAFLLPILLSGFLGKLFSILITSLSLKKKPFVKGDFPI